jgi:hypothetical protein
LFQDISIAESLKLLYRPTRGAIAFTFIAFLLISGIVGAFWNNHLDIQEEKRLIQARESFKDCYQKKCPYIWDKQLQQFVFSCTQSQSLDAEKCCKR